MDRHGTLRPVLVVSGRGLVDILGFYSSSETTVVVAWAKQDLFPMILDPALSVEVLSSLIPDQGLLPEWGGRLCPYEDGVPGAFLIEEPETFTIWGTASQIAASLATSVQNVERHLAHAFESGILVTVQHTKRSVVRCTIGNRTIRYEVTFYNIDAISAVCDRVSTQKAAEFRAWRAKLVEGYLLGYRSVVTRLADADAKVEVLDAKVEALEAALRQARSELSARSLKLETMKRQLDRSEESIDLYASTSLAIHTNIEAQVAAIAAAPMSPPERPTLTNSFFPSEPLKDFDIERLREYVAYRDAWERRSYAAMEAVIAADVAGDRMGAPVVPAGVCLFLADTLRIASAQDGEAQDGEIVHYMATGLDGAVFRLNVVSVNPVGAGALTP